MENTKSQKRLQNELKQCQKLEGVTVEATGDMTWKVTLLGPKETPYEGGKFVVQVNFPTEYPFKFPEFKFQTQMFHPNIDKDGNICEDMIDAKKWKPTSKISATFDLLCSIFTNVTEVIFNQDAANLHKSDINAYNEKVKEYTKKYAQ